MRSIKTLFVLIALLFSLPVIAGNHTSSASVANAQTKKTTKRRTTPSNVIYVPVGTDLKIRLNDTLSSKENRVGDPFTATVMSPTRFDEGTLRGHISNIDKSGKIKGRTSMTLAFDSLTMPDGRRDGVVRGYVTKVYGSDSGKADNEGNVESGSRTKQTVKRAGIGGVAGAIIGGIAGGGKGAAIGLLIGGAGGAGSLAIKGSKELKIESGTEMLVHVTK
jgi:3-oxoacyl-ACP reductase-like protein